MEVLPIQPSLHGAYRKQNSKFHSFFPKKQKLLEALSVTLNRGFFFSVLNNLVFLQNTISTPGRYCKIPSTPFK